MLQVEAEASSPAPAARPSPAPENLSHLPAPIVPDSDRQEDATAKEPETVSATIQAPEIEEGQVDSGSVPTKELDPSGIVDDSKPIEVIKVTSSDHIGTQNETPDAGPNPSIPGLGEATDSQAQPENEPLNTSATSNPPIPEEAAEGAEWEIDSSPYESSSDDSSDSDTSSEEDSDEDADGDYAMLDPEEAARILMQADGGSDDEGEGSRKKEGGPLRTANERMEEVIPKPDVVVTEDMRIEELGHVELVVENTVVIKAKTSGEYQVLEAGSLVCLKDRSVVGVVADLIGRVEEPRYTIRFTNENDIKEAGLWETHATVFYVPDHSTFVFTMPLKAVKGSDASNFHDEEVGDDEMEFSDDEAEAEHKRQMKAKRQGRTLENTGRGGRGGSKFPRGSTRGTTRGRGGFEGRSSNSADGSSYGNGSLEMNYDDVSMADTNDDGYTPLHRPADLADMMSRGAPPQTNSFPPPPPPLQFRRGDFGGRGRGGFGQNGRGRGGFRPNRGRGGFNQHDLSGHRQNGFTRQDGYSNSHNTTASSMPDINVLPITPSITPQNVSYPPMTPSPITPLPNVSFNFGNMGFQSPSNFPSFPPPPPPGTIPGLPQMPMFPQNFNSFQQQQQPNQYPPQQQNHAAAPNTTQAQMSNFLSGAWANNPAVAAALQRQVEEQRRAQGQ